MNMPTELVIFGRTYEIRNVSPLHASDGVLGMAAYRDAVIYVDTNLDPSLFLSTLWHEATHLAQQEILGTTNEDDARWIALFVHNLLIHNPSILECYRWLLNRRSLQ
jgi:hypothetical protein